MGIEVDVLQQETLLEQRDLEALQKKMLSLSLKYQRNFADAQDVVGETMEQLVKSYEKFQGRSSFQTWAYRICVNKNLEQLRKKKTIQEHLKTVVQETWYRMQGVGDEGFVPLREDFRKALEKLEDRERDVFLLTVYEELSQKEISEILELSVSNIKVILHRGRKKLMLELGSYLEGRS